MRTHYFAPTVQRLLIDRPTRPGSRRWLAPKRLLHALCAGLALGGALTLWAPRQAHAAPPVHQDSDAGQPSAKASSAAASAAGSSTTSAGKSARTQLSEALDSGVLTKKRMTLVINGKEKKYITIPVSSREPAVAQAAHASEPSIPAVAKRNARKPAAHGSPALRAQLTAASTGHDRAEAGHAAAHWSYDGDTGPQAWGKLQPEFNLCGLGKRQSPINIEDTTTLLGPAETLSFNYLPSNASVVNNGHTIQVDVSGDNSVSVRGSSYKLLQFHFHHPSEEQINFKSFAMVAHLVHRNAEGQLAVVAVLLELGAANPLLNQVWTYMPLDTADRVTMPPDLIDLNQLLPKDRRYYQFLGSLTTPPCTEGVLWMVLKQPMTLSQAQFKLFSQLYPNNARPVQAVNGRPVREAQ